MKKLGVDCGNTIFREWNGMLLPGSLETLQKLSASGTFDEIHIVSKANRMVRIFFRLRLRSLDFWKQTGIPRKNLHFCKQHKDKAAICKKIGITDFVDDRLQVLSHLHIEGGRYALNPTRKREFKKFPQTAEEVTIVSSWQELEHLLLPSVH
jgi:hypothetical protein